jgi:hypothetical protein
MPRLRCNLRGGDCPEYASESFAKNVRASKRGVRSAVAFNFYENLSPARSREFQVEVERPAGFKKAGLRFI